MIAADQATSLYWLPAAGRFGDDVAQVKDAKADPDALFARLVSLAARRLDHAQLLRVDRLLISNRDRLPKAAPRLRLALLGSSTLDQLEPGIRVGALRHGLIVETMVAPYGQWRQFIADAHSALYEFAPDAVALMLDAAAILPDLPLATPADAVAGAIDAAVSEISGYWRRLQDRRRTAVIQLVPWSDEPALFGHFERKAAASPGALAARLAGALVDRAAEAGVALLDLRGAAAAVGTRQLGDPALRHHAKQTIAPLATSWVGDHVARVLAALRGMAKKVLVLDLDNTLWGGTIGDDGPDGIVLGPGSGAGEAFAAFQKYAKRLAERGILLAISSKNEPAIVDAVLAEHPEMVLRRDDFAAIEVGWHDKPSALRRIAKDLNLGLDSLVFVDDNPVERDLVRRTLPMVAVPELPEGPELYPYCLADAGYFETVSFTPDDAKRSAHYAANRERQRLEASATDIDSFLRDLEMLLTVGPFKPTDVPRIAQLINKTNQFNLTTKRYSETEVRALMYDPEVLTLSARLSDRFGDNGLTAVVVGRAVAAADGPAVELDSWLMSCRVLGRGVEQAMLTVIADRAQRAGARHLIGRYRPTPRNALVKDLYAKLGFALLETDDASGETAWSLSLPGAALPPAHHLSIVYNG